MVACTDYLVLKRKEIKTFFPKNGRSGSRPDRVKTQNTEILMFSVFSDKAVVNDRDFARKLTPDDCNSHINNPLRTKNKIKRNASLSRKLKRRFAPCYFPKRF